MKIYEVIFYLNGAKCKTWPYEATVEDAKAYVLRWYPDAKIRLVEEIYFR